MGRRTEATAIKRASGGHTGSKTGAASKRRLLILFTCVGRRVELVRAFRRAAERLKLQLEIYGADATLLSPAMHCVDRRHVVPTIVSGRYIDALVDIVSRRRIDLLIPLIDSELPSIAAAVKRFADLGCRALISSEPVVNVCRDKLATYELLTRSGIDTPATWIWTEARLRRRHRFPYYLKPRRGSAAMGNFIINNRNELETLGLRIKDAIVQEYVEGDEYTLDVYTGFDGPPRCVVPRKRLEVRSGEVSKGIIVKDRAIMAMGRRVAEVLDGCRGVITVQCMVTPQRRIRVIEMNPRFGGGVPLSIHAGADFPRWILQEHLGLRHRINPTGFRDGVAMLRYDDSIFVANASRLVPSLRTRL